MSVVTRFLQNAIMIGDLDSVKRNLPRGDILYNGNCGTRIYYITSNECLLSMLQLAVFARQYIGNSPISDLQNRPVRLIEKNEYGNDKSHNRTRSQYRFEVVKLLLEKAKHQGIVNELLSISNNLTVSDKIYKEYFIDELICDANKSDFEQRFNPLEERFHFNENTFTYKTAFIIIKAAMDSNYPLSELYNKASYII
jgi:hypothetical protein